MECRLIKEHISNLTQERLNDMIEVSFCLIKVSKLEYGSWNLVKFKLLKESFAVYYVFMRNEWLVAAIVCERYFIYTKIETHLKDVN